MTSFLVMIILIAIYNLEIYQIDVKITFLHGEIFYIQIGFLKIKVDPNVKIKRSTQKFVILELYVNDFVLVLNNIPFFNTSNKELFQAFDTINSGELHYYLGIQVHWNRPHKTIHINQAKYILEKL